MCYLMIAKKELYLDRREDVKELSGEDREETIIRILSKEKSIFFNKERKYTF